jgi:glutaminyl-tRNA synthetase
VDPDTKPDKPVFNRTVALRDTWAKIEKKSEKKSK